MVNKKNTLPVLAIITILLAVGVAVFSLMQLESLKNADDITSIESELNSTNLNNLDLESAEIGSLLE